MSTKAMILAIGARQHPGRNVVYWDPSDLQHCCGNLPPRGPQFLARVEQVKSDAVILSKSSMCAQTHGALLPSNISLAPLLPSPHTSPPRPHATELADFIKAWAMAALVEDSIQEPFSSWGSTLLFCFVATPCGTQG